MAQQTELSVLSLPGPVHTFAAKEEAPLMEMTGTLSCVTSIGISTMGNKSSLATSGIEAVTSLDGAFTSPE